MNRMERRAAWLARHRQQSQPAASQSNTQHAGHSLRAHGFEQSTRATTAIAEQSAQAATASERSERGATASAHASINLHVGELVLHGFAPHDRYRIGDAVQHELARLLTTQGTPSALRASGERARVNAGSFNVAQGAVAKSIGHRVARAVYGELKR
jgi:hypothetical protein